MIAVFLSDIHPPGQDLKGRDSRFVVHRIVFHVEDLRWRTPLRLQKPRSRTPRGCHVPKVSGPNSLRPIARKLYPFRLLVYSKVVGGTSVLSISAQLWGSSWVSLRSWRQRFVR